VLEDREVATQARETPSPARQGFVSICAKVVRLVDWPVDWKAISRHDRHVQICRKLLILHGIFGSSVTVDQVLQQYLPQAGIRRFKRLDTTVWFSRLVLTLHGSLALSLAADVVVLPLHTRH
jgi:hypothetical protein